MFTRSQFEATCKAFSRRHSEWTWVDGHTPGYGYLTRTTSHFYKAFNSHSRYLIHPASTELENEEEDEATAQPAQPILTAREFVVYSASFSVPAFYFTIHDTNGAPLSLMDILRTSLFKSDLPGGSEATDFALTFPSASFPLLSQGDHPTLGTPCWYLHPCESDTAVGEFLREVEQPDWNEESRLVRWLELWLMVVGSVLIL
ncbi:hypothetical protein CPB84DRAFT_1840622 [Gymnopilus junonius]|uniref:Ubiquitin-like-conjugating enzyme ATG10 n=1 Tax=Gymnopilus junonius TaxID=109634 RepID=A0A9P5TTP1_GYMJU|nr:hypothetical protein CPB84DRAFT_1840622 [Gymnopilus junonius]